MEDTITLSDQVGDKIIYEDDYCRVWTLALEPGEATSWHVHEYDYVYVVTGASAARTEYVDKQSEEQRDQVGATSLRATDDGHRLLNVGDHPYRNIIVELKRRSSDAAT